MAGFWVSSDVDLRRAKDSLKKQLIITITGTTDDGRIGHFTGVVTSIAPDLAADERWRVTLDSL